MDVTLHEATTADLPAVKNLVPYYIYDMSEHMGWPCTADGRFDGCDDLESYWSARGKHAFVLRAADELAGFVLILADNPDPQIDYSITDFFVLRKFRGQGVGQRIAHELFNRFRGRWKVEQFAKNKPAVAFWHKVIDRYTRGDFKQSAGDSQWGPMNVLLFRSDTRLPVNATETPAPPHPSASE
jgi:predicted acetyltransferase